MNKNRSLILRSTLVVVLLILLLYRIPAVQVLTPDGSFYLKDQTFEIGWIHSVEKEPWYETYQIQDEGLLLVKTRFKTFGAGTPSDGEIIPSDDGFVHMKINRKMEEIHLVVSRDVKTTLYAKTLTIPLFEIVNNHENVDIKVVKLPIWQWLRGENIGK